MYNHEEYSEVPAHVLDALDRYGKDATPLGGFLTAVVSNDLQGAVGRADPESMTHLKQITTYVTCQLPPYCHGSRQSVREWRGHV